ncbi:TetR/AcrR family transcriptional regulator [Kitasatospora sp. NBC_01560]|uniref:TetR/AcrR family transcriptional regulator n=1 Tax=Kitasatospora sp. NBC_01560 TaxID=2975965 RepID=UPI00386942E5
MVLQRAAEIASVEGLENVSLGRLGVELHLSKSGVFSLFGSKEELQLATVRAAIRIYIEDLLNPNRRLPHGIVRVWRLCESWLGHSRSRVFPGGCFFFATSVEFSARRGQVRDLIAGAQREWNGHLEQLIGRAIELGELEPDTDRVLLAFELIALLDGANRAALLHGDDAAYARSGRAILNRLRDLATDASVLPATV